MDMNEVGLSCYKSSARFVTEEREVQERKATVQVFERSVMILDCFCWLGLVSAMLCGNEIKLDDLMTWVY